MGALTYALVYRITFISGEGRASGGQPTPLGPKITVCG